MKKLYLFFLLILIIVQCINAKEETKDDILDNSFLVFKKTNCMSQEGSNSPQKPFISSSLSSSNDVDGIEHLRGEGLPYKEFYNNKYFLSIYNNDYQLANETVRKWSWARFLTKKYIDNNKEKYSTNFTLVQEKDGSYIIQSNFGETSYLTHEIVKKDSWNWCFFATKEYIDNNKGKCSINFTLVQEKDGSYIIQSNFGETSYLTIKPINEGSFETAFFATKQYIDSNKYFKTLKFFPIESSFYPPPS